MLTTLQSSIKSKPKFWVPAVFALLTSYSFAFAFILEYSFAFILAFLLTFGVNLGILTPLLRIRLLRYESKSYRSVAILAIGVIAILIATVFLAIILGPSVSYTRYGEEVTAPNQFLIWMNFILLFLLLVGTLCYEVVQRSRSSKRILPTIVLFLLVLGVVALNYWVLLTISSGLFWSDLYL